tara:strand:- start:198 stop:308 length:111 start_codon:yes stop_codon:yes gene_type:complete
MKKGKEYLAKCDGLLCEALWSYAAFFSVLFAAAFAA